MAEAGDLSALRGQLVELIVQQGNVISNWVKFAITIQGGLVAGVGFVFSDVTKYRALGVIVALFGFLAAVLFAKILRRHVQWVSWYVVRCNSLTATSKLFPDEKDAIEKQDVGPVGGVVDRFMYIVAAAWIVILLVVVGAGWS